MMKNIKTFFLIFLMSVSYLFAQKFNPTLASQLQTKLESFNVSTGISACVVIPCDSGTWVGVDGLSTSTEDINSDMLFGIGSCTKSFTAAIILKLQEIGLLNIDNPISNYIDVSGYPNIDGTITIRQLLNHSSGLADYTSDPYIMQYADQNRSYLFSNSDILGTVGNPQFSPGSSWAYCNTNYYLAGMIIESITGTNLESAYNNYIFSPINLDNIFLGAWETIPSSYNFAHGWYYNQYTWQWVDYSLDSYNSYFSLASSAGCLVSTAQNLAEYAQSVFTGQIISQASINEMTNFNSSNYGLGCEKATKAGKTVWGHNGCIQGYASQFLFDPDWRISVAILCNDQGADVETYIDELFQVVVNNYHPLSFSINSTVNVSCFGGSDGAVYTSASGSAAPFTYSWTNTPQTTANITNLTENTYTATITDMNGCSEIVSTTITQPNQLETNISGTDVTNNNNNGEANLFVTGGTPQYNYSWSNGATTENISNLSGGTYYVTVTDANGCIVIDSVIINNPVNISEYNPLPISIYPNPTINYLNLNFNNLSGNEISIEILSIDGKNVFSKKINHISNFYQIDVSTFNHGIYFIKIKSDDIIYIKKFFSFNNP